MTPEERLTELGHALPQTPQSIANYVGAVHTGNLLFLSGKGPDLIGGRRWVQSPYGNVNWVRNLRVAREATLTTGKRDEPVQAVPLSPDEAVTFFGEVLGPYLRKSALSTFIARRLGLGDAIDDPAGAARSHPVFELKPAR